MSTIVVIGGGLAGGTVVTSLREGGFEGDIVLFAAEPHAPYERPPLSKDYLMGKKPIEKAYVHDEGWYAAHDVDLRTDTEVVAIDRDAKVVRTTDGAEQPYDQLVIATGAVPRHLALADGSGAHTAYLRTIEDSDRIREFFGEGRRIVVIGAGWIGLEVAAAAREAGSEVTVFESAELPLLRVLGPTVAQVFADLHCEHGVDLRLRCTVRSVTREHGALIVTLADGERLAADTVLYATGRAPNTEGLCLEMAGVQQDEQGSIRVDAHYRSSVPSIHAVGDVCTRFQLTPVALAEAMVVVDRLFGEGQRALAYDFIPTAVFTHPNIGTVGLTEAQARERHPEIDVYRTDFRPLKHTLSGSTERTFMKLVVDRASDRVVGLHMVGAEAGEIVQGFAVAVRMGATKAQFDATLGIHPTSAEELVTMRERCPDPDHAMTVEHAESAGRRRIVHHRWEDGEG